MWSKRWTKVKYDHYINCQARGCIERLIYNDQHNHENTWGATWDHVLCFYFEIMYRKHAPNVAEFRQQWVVRLSVCVWECVCLCVCVCPSWDERTPVPAAGFLCRLQLKGGGLKALITLCVFVWVCERVCDMFKTRIDPQSVWLDLEPRRCWLTGSWRKNLRSRRRNRGTTSRTWSMVQFPLSLCVWSLKKKKEPHGSFYLTAWWHSICNIWHLIYVSHCRALQVHRMLNLHEFPCDFLSL